MSRSSEFSSDSYGIHSGPDRFELFMCMASQKPARFQIFKRLSDKTEILEVDIRLHSITAESVDGNDWMLEGWVTSTSPTKFDSSFTAYYKTNARETEGKAKGTFSVKRP